jgi:hypothetical protein
MSDRPNEEQENLRRLLAAATDIVGAGAGAGIGHVLGGPVGAAAGGMYGAMARIMLQDVALDFTHRMLGEREKARVGAAVYYFAEKYQEKLDAGERPRQDGFFDDPPDDRAAAKELFEATLLAAQREHQEKKLRFFGNLMANIAFHPEIDRAQANYLIQLAEELSYRQLCLLSLFMNRDHLGIRLRQGDYRGGGISTTEQVVLLQEIYDLYLRSMVHDSGGSAMLGLTDVNPDTVSVLTSGFTLYTLMELDTVEDQDLLPLIRLLQ